jgi:hypothetical protein
VEPGTTLIRTIHVLNQQKRDDTGLVLAQCVMFLVRRSCPGWGQFVTVAPTNRDPFRGRCCRLVETPPWKSRSDLCLRGRSGCFVAAVRDRHTGAALPLSVCAIGSASDAVSLGTAHWIPLGSRVRHQRHARFACAIMRHHFRP